MKTNDKQIKNISSASIFPKIEPIQDPVTKAHILPFPKTIDLQASIPSKSPEMIIMPYTDFYDQTHEIEVTKEFYDKYQAILKDERRVERKETRRHTSLDNLTDKGFEFATPCIDPLAQAEQKELVSSVQHAILTLLPQQQKLIKQMFYENLSMTEIARLENVDPSAIRHRWGRIKSKIRKIL